MVSVRRRAIGAAKWLSVFYPLGMLMSAFTPVGTSSPVPSSPYSFNTILCCLGALRNQQTRRSSRLRSSELCLLIQMGRAPW